MSKETAMTQPLPDMAITESGFSPKSFDEAWRYANALAATQFVPATYQKKPNDCFVAIDISMRLRVHPMMFLQNSYIVHGRPALEAKLVQALVNKSNLFEDPLEYEVVGTDPANPDYQVRAFATRKSTGSVLYGPWITWPLIKGEGWDSKSGSKWKTMPEVMFHYRAASWFCNRHCPEVKMGFMTSEEADEAARKPIESKTIKSGITGVKAAMQGTTAKQEDTPAKDVAKKSKDDDRGTEAPQADPTTAAETAGTSTVGKAECSDPQIVRTADDQDAQNQSQDSATTANDSSDDPVSYVCTKCGSTDIGSKTVRDKCKPWCGVCHTGKNVSLVSSVNQ